MAENRGPGDSARKSRRSRPKTIDLKATHIPESESETTPFAAGTPETPVGPQQEAEPRGEFSAPPDVAGEVQGPPRPEEFDARPVPGPDGAAAVGPEMPDAGEADVAGERPTSLETADETPQTLGHAENGEPWRPASSADAVETNDGGTDGRSGLGALFAAGLAGALIAVTGLVLLAMLELLPLPGGADAAIANRLTALERQVAERPQAPAGEAADPRVDALAASLEETRGQAQASNAAIEQLRAQLAQAGEQPAGGAPAEDPRVGELVSRVDQINAQIAEIGPAIDELKAGNNDGEMQQQLFALDTRVQQAGDAASALEGRVSAVEGSVETIGRLEAGVKEMEGRVEAARQAGEEAANRAQETAAIALLDSAAAQGGAYGDALDRVKALAPDTSVDALQAAAENGLVPVREPAEELMRQIAALPAPGPSGEASLVDRLLIGAQGLVSIRPVDGARPAAEPGSARARVHELLSSGAYSEALEAWEGLDETAKRETQGAADRLRARLAAEQELQALRQRALATTGEANGGTEP